MLSYKWICWLLLDHCSMFVNVEQECEPNSKLLWVMRWFKLSNLADLVRRTLGVFIFENLKSWKPDGEHVLPKPYKYYALSSLYICCLEYIEFFWSLSSFKDMPNSLLASTSQKELPKSWGILHHFIHSSHLKIPKTPCHLSAKRKDEWHGHFSKKREREKREDSPCSHL